MTKNTLNSDILTEKELNDLKLNEYKKQFGHNQEVEKFIRDLPYSDDFPRLNSGKHYECRTVMTRSFSFGFLFGCFFAPVLARYRYNFVLSHRDTIKFLFPSCFIFGSFVALIAAFSPFCQIINRGIMDNVQLEEEIYRILVEKCDLYDNIDAILSLKQKYSLYELEQLNKERTLKKNKIIVENMENYAKMRKGISENI